MAFKGQAEDYKTAMFATDTQPTQTKIELGHVYASSQLQNSYVPPEITDQMKASLQGNKSSSHIPCTFCTGNCETKKHLQTKKKVASPDYVGVK